MATLIMQCNEKMLSAPNLTKRILCVDDDPDIQAAIALKLQDFDVEVVPAYFGMQGISEAMCARPDLILMDIAMPNGDGGYSLECIKAHRNTAHIPVIVISGMRDPAIKKRVLLQGADIFMHKPINFDDLIHQMGRFVDIRRSTIEKDTE